MKNILIIVFGVLLSACASTGKNNSVLETWNTVGENIWTVKNGVTTSSATPGKSYLVSPDTYTNFRLEIEFMPDEQVNSGVFVNCKNNTEIGSKNCFEANISDNHKKPEFRTGSIVRHAPPASKSNTIGKWNKMVFTVNAGKVSVEINGVKTAEASSAAHPSGYIGLQRFKGGVIQFRNMSITPL
ncbi:MAG: 3-keto-disaccharide hydrolase [Arenicella sp.]